MLMEFSKFLSNLLMFSFQFVDTSFPFLPSSAKPQLSWLSWFYFQLIQPTTHPGKVYFLSHILAGLSANLIQQPNTIFAKLSLAPAKLAELVLFPAYPTNPPTTGKYFHSLKCKRKLCWAAKHTKKIVIAPNTGVNKQ